MDSSNHTVLGCWYLAG